MKLPPHNLEVIPITAAYAAQIVIAEHYLHRRPPISHAYGLSNGFSIIGVCTFGTPASRHLQISACRTNPSAVIELNRLWVHDMMPRNTESWFVSRALRALPAHIVVSYADTAAGHQGFIYRALSWHYAGWTDMERKTPRLDYIPHQPGKHTREATRTGIAAKVRRQPKVRYWTTTGNRTERKQLAQCCTWPIMDWRSEPPPEAQRVQHHTSPTPHQAQLPL